MSYTKIGQLTMSVSHGIMDVMFYYFWRIINQNHNVLMGWCFRLFKVDFSFSAFPSQPGPSRWQSHPIPSSRKNVSSYYGQSWFISDPLILWSSCRDQGSVSAVLVAGSNDADVDVRSDQIILSTLSTVIHICILCIYIYKIYYNTPGGG